MVSRRSIGDTLENEPRGSFEEDSANHTGYTVIRFSNLTEGRFFVEEYFTGDRRRGYFPSVDTVLSLSEEHRRKDYREERSVDRPCDFVLFSPQE